MRGCHNTLFPSTDFVRLALSMTFRTDQYQLLDFGDGRKLERFGTLVLDRPSTAAQGIAKSRPDRWPEADARFEKGEADQGDCLPLL